MESFKPLAKLGYRSLLQRAVTAFTVVGVHDLIVVAGHRADEVTTAAAQCGVRVVVNTRYKQGMYSSVRAGVAALQTNVERFFVLPVDCAVVRPETVGLLARQGATVEADVVLPTNAGAAGHPPLLRMSLRDEILASEPPQGLRSLLAAHSAETVVCEVGDPGVVMDADTPRALEDMRRWAAGEELPDERRCHELLREHGASVEAIAHCEAVAEMSTALTNALNERGQHLCLPLVAAAALLHDIVRAAPRHAESGRRLLDGLGYRRLSPTVRRHRGVGLPGDGDIDEAAVVFLADALVLGERLVPAEERFGVWMRQFAARPEALAGARSRRAMAVRVRENVEQVLGRRIKSSLSVQSWGAKP